MGLWGTALLVLAVSAFWVVIPHLLSPSLPPVWGGKTREDFKRVEQLFRKVLSDGRVKGAAVAAYYKGEVIVDLWGGYADLESMRPWKTDTMTVLYSTTKFVGAVVIAQLVDKGLLDYSKPVSSYWPEFAQNGKEDITVEMLLGHQAGLPFLDKGISHLDLIHKQKEVEEKLVKQAPIFTPGTQCRYHAMTWGLYVDTLARKVDPKHRNMSQIFHEDIAVPFGIDIYIGVPRHEFHRMARVYPMTFLHFLEQFMRDPDPADIKRIYLMMPFSDSETSKRVKTVTDFTTSSPGFMNDPEKAAVGLTSLIGQASARGVAKLASILANGGSYKGKQLLSPQVISKMSSRIVKGFDETVQMDIRFARGPAINTNREGKNIFGHPGFGGQVGFGDPHNGLGFAYVSNHLSKYGVWNDPIMLELQDAIYDVIYDKGDNS